MNVLRHCPPAGLLLAVAVAWTMLLPAKAGETAKPSAAVVAEPVRVVYQFSEGADQALRGMRNINNHLNADPTAKIVVVAFGRGVDFLLDGAKDANGQPFDATVAALTARGVEFRVCANTLRGLEIPADKVNPEALVVPSGVAEIARLQARHGHAYIRP